MTRKLNLKKDADLVRCVQRETPELLKLRMMMNVLDHSESNGMSRIYTLWAKNNNK